MYLRDFRTRKPNRAKGFDYKSRQRYFVTVCAKDKFELFGRINSGVMSLSELGEIVQGELKRMAVPYEGVEIQASVVMPNHVHMVVEVVSFSDATISRVVQQWKRAVSKRAGYSPWQKSFHDHVIRDDDALAKIVEYISDNIKNWEHDCYNHRHKRL